MQHDVVRPPNITMDGKRLCSVDYSKNNCPFSRNRASIDAVPNHAVSGDRGPRDPNFVSTAMGGSEIGAVRGILVSEKCALYRAD